MLTSSSMRRYFVIFCCGLGLWIAPTAFGQESCKDQTPRRLEKWNTKDAPATIKRGPTDDVITYIPEGKPPVTLQRCSQHYHCWIENLQPLCSDQHASSIGGPVGGCPARGQLPVGSWVEIHTAYSAEVGIGCDPETLNCCTKGPFVVLGYHAKVTADTTQKPVPVMDWSLAAAEWSGSNTGPDDGGCKPVAAKWRFSLGCDQTIGLGQLGLFCHADQARGLQPADRLSSDLNLLPQ